MDGLNYMTFLPLPTLQHNENRLRLGRERLFYHSVSQIILVFTTCHLKRYRRFTTLTFTFPLACSLPSHSYTVKFRYLRPPKIKTSYQLKILFAKFKLFFFLLVSTPSVPLIRDHLWGCPKVVLKTTFEQSQRWS